MILFLSAALAFDTADYAWPPESMPIRLEWAGTPAGLDHDETQAALEAAVAAWAGETCGGVTIELVEVDATRVDATDGRSQVVFEDPDGDVAAGDPSAAYPVFSTDDEVTYNGQRYYVASTADIVLGDGLAWSTDAEVEAGACQGGYSAQAALTHEVGHLLGLGHPCAEGDACADEEEREATMYGDLAECDTSASTLGQDDVAGIQQIYAHVYDYGCLPSLDDPYAVACATDPFGGDPYTGVTWDFGDGTVVEEDEPTHRYEAPGEYRYTVCVTYPDCAGPTCRTGNVTIVAPGTAEGEWDTATGSESDDRGGCVSAGSSGRASLTVALGLALAGMRRRRRS